MRPVSDGQRTALDFLSALRQDQVRGTVRSLREYLARYPGHEETVAREFVLHARTGAPRLAASGDQDQAAEVSPRFGRFRILDELGRGGQGVVYLAHDTRLQRKVALKTLRAPLGPGGGGGGLRARRLFREAIAASRLAHPGICTVFESGHAEGTLYLAMRYVEGESLAQRLRSTSRPPRTRKELATVVRMIEAAARALQAAHEAGIVHRDIKPGNIMLQPDGSPVLLDFGLAADTADELATLTLSGETMGTPAYMSPEQLDPAQRADDPRTDIWSLGVVLFEALTLERPFHALTRETLYLAIRRQPPRSARQLNPAIDPDLAAILAVALEKDPRRRYAAMAAFAEDLDRWLRHEPVLARPPGLWRRCSAWVARNPVVSISVAAVVLLLSMALAMTWSFAGRERELRATAEARTADLRQQSRTFLFAFYEAVRDLPGATRARELASESARRYLQKLRADADEDPSLLAELVVAHVHWGDALGNDAYTNLGRPQEARRSFETALQLAERRLQLAPSDGARSQLALAHERVGLMAFRDHRHELARRHFEAAAALMARLTAPRGQPERHVDLARRRSLVQMHLARTERDPQRRENGLRAALARNLELQEQAPGNLDLVEDEVSFRLLLGDGLEDRGRTAEAVREYRRSLAAVQRLLQQRDADAGLLRRRGQVELALGCLLCRTGRLEEGQELLAAARAGFGSLAAGDANDAHARRMLVEADLQAGDVLASSGRFSAALELFEPACAAIDGLRTRWPQLPLDSLLLRACYGRGAVLAQLGRGDEAARWLREAVRRWQELAANDNVSRRTAYLGHVASLQLTASLHGAGLAAALDSIDESLRRWRRQLGPELLKELRARVANTLAVEALFRDDIEVARKEWSRLLELVGRKREPRERDRISKLRIQAHAGLFRVYKAMDDVDRARAFAERARELLDEMLALRPGDLELQSMDRRRRKE